MPKPELSTIATVTNWLLVALMVLALLLSIFLVTSSVKYAFLPVISLVALVGVSLRRRIGYAAVVLMAVPGLIASAIGRDPSLLLLNFFLLVASVFVWRDLGRNSDSRDAQSV